MGNVATAPRGKKRTVRTRGPSPEKTAQTCQSIVSAALGEFLEKGFANATMEGVAKRAGVAKGTPYRYFPTKESLFASVVRERIATALIDVLPSKRGKGEKVGDFLRRALLASTRDIERSGRGSFAALVLVEGARFPALVDIYREELLAPLLKRIRSLASEARRTGEIESDVLVRFPQLLLAPIWLGIVNNQLLDKGHPLDIAALLEQQLDLLLGRAR